MPAFTQKLILSSKPKEALYELRDSKVQGLVLRVYPSGRKVFICQYARGKRKNIGRADLLTLTEARNRALDILANGPVAVSKLTLRQYADDHYSPWVRATKRGARETLRSLEAELGGFMSLKMSRIDMREVERWRTQRLEAGISKATLNRNLTTLKSALNRAVEWGLLPVNAMAKVKPYRLDKKGVVRFLSDDEDRRLRAVLKGQLRDLVLFSLNTGLRRAELYQLEWKDIDLPSRMMTVRGTGTKTEQTRHVPLNKEAFAILGEPTTGLVFPSEVTGEKLTNNQKSWASTLKAAEITRFRWHDLRHTFASRLVQKGVPLYIVAKLLGHSDTRMTERYAHLAPEHLADAVNLLGEGGNG